DGTQTARRRMEALDHFCGEQIAVQILAEALLDTGAQDLDGDGLERAVGKADLRFMNLRDRGGGDGRAETCEQRIDGRLERLLDGGSGFVLREGRQAILQCRKVGRELPA